MKDFSKRQFLIGRSPLETRLVYTFFLIFLLCGFLSIAGYEFARIGISPQEVSEHYLGSQGEGLKFEKEFNSILETFHFHAFIMGIIYLTVAHIFVATTFPSRGKIAILILAFTATLLDLLLPWAIRYASPAFVPVLIAAWVGEWISYMVMIVYPLYDMWVRVPRMEREG